MNKTELLRLNLQFFAEDGGSGSPAGSDGGQGTETPDDVKVPAEGAGDVEETLGQLTDETIQQLLGHDLFQKEMQRNADRVRTEYSKKLKSAQERIEELETSRMSEKERADYEIQKREKQLKERESELMKKEVSIAATNELVAKKMPLQFAELVAGATVEETMERVETLSDLWKNAIDEAVAERFKQQGTTPGRSVPGETPAASTNVSFNDAIRQAVRGG